MDFGDQIMDDVVEGLVQNIGRLMRTLAGRPGHYFTCNQAHTTFAIVPAG